MLALLVAPILLGGELCLAASELSMVSTQMPNPAVLTIHPGMTRAEVESILQNRDGGPQSISSTRYYQEPNWIVEVPYDQTGGTWTPANRVIGSITLQNRPRSTL